MRDYGRVFSAFWQSEDTRNFSEDGRVLALYLLTSPHANLIGCFRLPDAYAADDMQWSFERVREGFKELQRKGFLTRDEGSKWTLIHKYLKWNAFENGNVAIAAHRAFDQVPDVPLKSLLALALLEHGLHIKEAFRNSLETLREPFANPEPEPEPILNLNQNQSLNLIPSGTCFDGPPAEAASQRKRARSKKDAAPTSETWTAYATAYAVRYRVEPVRNATVNGQLANFVSRIGAVEAPPVAAFYVRSNNARYVSSGHSVGMMLMDAEKLRTEWATGRQATATQAMLADKTQTNLNAFAGMIAEAQAEEQNAER